MAVENIPSIGEPPWRSRAMNAVQRPSPSRSRAMQAFGDAQFLHLDGTEGVEVAGVAVSEVLGVISGVWGWAIGHPGRDADRVAGRKTGMRELHPPLIFCK